MTCLFLARAFLDIERYAFLTCTLQISLDIPVLIAAAISDRKTITHAGIHVALLLTSVAIGIVVVVVVIIIVIVVSVAIVVAIAVLTDGLTLVLKSVHLLLCVGIDKVHHVDDVRGIASTR